MSPELAPKTSTIQVQDQAITGSSKKGLSIIVTVIGMKTKYTKSSGPLALEGLEKKPETNPVNKKRGRALPNNHKPNDLPNREFNLRLKSSNRKSPRQINKSHQPSRLHRHRIKQVNKTIKKKHLVHSKLVLKTASHSSLLKMFSKIKTSGTKK